MHIKWNRSLDGTVRRPGHTRWHIQLEGASSHVAARPADMLNNGVSHDDEDDKTTPPPQALHDAGRNQLEDLSQRTMTATSAAATPVLLQVVDSGAQEDTAAGGGGSARIENGKVPQDGPEDVLAMSNNLMVENEDTRDDNNNDSNWMGHGNSPHQPPPHHNLVIMAKPMVRMKKEIMHLKSKRHQQYNGKRRSTSPVPKSYGAGELARNRLTSKGALTTLVGLFGFKSDSSGGDLNGRVGGGASAGTNAHERAPYNRMRRRFSLEKLGGGGGASKSTFYVPASPLEHYPPRSQKSVAILRRRSNSLQLLHDINNDSSLVSSPHTLASKQHGQPPPAPTATNKVPLESTIDCDDEAIGGGGVCDRKTEKEVVQNKHQQHSAKSSENVAPTIPVIKTATASISEVTVMRSSLVKFIDDEPTEVVDGRPRYNPSRLTTYGRRSVGGRKPPLPRHHQHLNDIKHEPNPAMQPGHGILRVKGGSTNSSVISSTPPSMSPPPPPIVFATAAEAAADAVGESARGGSSNIRNVGGHVACHEREDFAVTSDLGSSRASSASSTESYSTKHVRFATPLTSYAVF